jgi:hypothetical protein
MEVHDEVSRLCNDFWPSAVIHTTGILMAESRIIPWITITVEAVAIVLSILMAFAIDAWWVEKKENDVE